MEQFKDIMRLIRWQNLLMTAIVLFVTEKWVATPLLNNAYFGEQLPWWILLLLTIATMLIAAGGYIINDYFDVRIDAINRPDRLIVTRSISKAHAMRLFQIVTAIGVITGLIVAWCTRSWLLAAVFIFVPGLLWFYSASYKRQLLIGNITIALISAITPLTIAMANAAYMRHLYGVAMDYTPISTDIYTWVGGFAGFAFLATFIREVIKDLQDQQGDRELECHTLPVVWGERATKVILTILLLCMAGAIIWLGFFVLPFPLGWRSLHVRYIVLGLLIPIACELWLLLSARISSDYRSAQLMMKFIMLMGVLYSYVILHTL